MEYLSECRYRTYPVFDHFLSKFWLNSCFFPTFLQYFVCYFLHFRKFLEFHCIFFTEFGLIDTSFVSSEPLSTKFTSSLACDVAHIMSSSLLYQLLLCAVTISLLLLGLIADETINSSIIVSLTALLSVVVPTYYYCSLSEKVTQDLYSGFILWIYFHNYLIIHLININFPHTISIFFHFNLLHTLDNSYSLVILPFNAWLKSWVNLLSLCMQAGSFPSFARKKQSAQNQHDWDDFLTEVSR